MRVPLVAANWKMHGSRRFVEDFFAAIQAKQESQAKQERRGKESRDTGRMDVAVFPPHVYLQQAVAAARGIGIGAQNLSAEPEGAFTGEISAAMVADIGCRLVLVGHSERRILFAEDDDLVARKYQAALGQDLLPVLCVGETLAERERGETLAVVKRQLQAVADLVGLDNVAAGVIAYEPVWAIGTGVTASPQQAQEVHRGIRDMLGSQGAETRILYGGSVKAANAEALFSQPDIDGGLVGGASLDADEFAAICDRAQST